MVRDFTATSLIGPQATAAQNVNAQFASCLYHCWYNLTFVESEFPGKVWEILKPAVNVSLPSNTGTDNSPYIRPRSE
jgi:hypothetical protein